MRKLLSISVIVFYIFFINSLDALAERVIVIGAGPSGIEAARALKDKGYDVIILEQAPEVGGKVKTVVYEGRPYEIGAVITAPDYKLVLKIANEVNATLVPTPESITCDLAGHEEAMLEWSNGQYGMMKYLKMPKDFAKFAAYVKWHSDFFEPGFEHTPTAMNTTFEEFMTSSRMQSVLEAFRPVMVGCGYGYAESMPAAYWMKLMKTFGYQYSMSFFSSAPFYQGFRDGWQKLWKDYVALKNLNVQLNTTVTSIKRAPSEGGVVTVKTNRGNMTADRVILTVPHLAPDFLDLNHQEHTLFSYVRTLPYKVTLAKIDGLPQKHHIWLRKNSYMVDKDGMSNDGKPVLISSNQDTNVYQIYQFTEQGKSSANLQSILIDTVNKMGGTIVEIISEDTFTYFPHFSVEAFKLKLAQQFDQIQGRGGVYYTGALPNFETVELSAQHAEKLVRDHF